MTTPTEIIDTGLFPDPTPVSEPVPVDFVPELATPSLGALYANTGWIDEGQAPPRWLMSRVQVRRRNYGLDVAVGIWGAGWCGDPGDDLKTGTRPGSLEPFEPVTVWGYDDCDTTPASRTEVHARAAHNLAMRESVAVERELAVRMLTDAGVPVGRAGVQSAVGALEAALAVSGTTGLIHCSPEHIGYLDEANLIRRVGSLLYTPLGSRWVFGGGYVTALGRVLIATSPTVGWRTPIETRDAIEPETGTAISIAERSVLIGYEHAIAAVQL